MMDWRGQIHLDRTRSREQEQANSRPGTEWETATMPGHEVVASTFPVAWRVCTGAAVAHGGSPHRRIRTVFSIVAKLALLRPIFIAQTKDSIGISKRPGSHALLCASSKAYLLTPVGDALTVPTLMKKSVLIIRKSERAA
jgi:hypothetical protein